jgi:hypothetical protein
MNLFLSSSITYYHLDATLTNTELHLHITIANSECVTNYMYLNLCPILHGISVYRVYCLQGVLFTECTVFRNISACRYST